MLLPLELELELVVALVLPLLDAVFVWEGFGLSKFVAPRAARTRTSPDSRDKTNLDDADNAGEYKACNDDVSPDDECLFPYFEVLILRPALTAPLPLLREADDDAKFFEP